MCASKDLDQTARMQSLCLSLEYSVTIKLLTDMDLEFLNLKRAALARLSLHSSKCRIIRNHMLRLNSVVTIIMYGSVCLIPTSGIVFVFLLVFQSSSWLRCLNCIFSFCARVFVCVLFSSPWCHGLVCNP